MGDGYVPDTRLARAIRARERYRTFVHRHEPKGANGTQWDVWIACVHARRGMFAIAIAAAREEKRFNQRSKANERKHTNHGAARADRG